MLWVILAAAVVLILVWAVVLLLGLSAWIALAATAVVTLVVAVYLVVKKLLSHQSAKEIEKNIVSHGEADVESTRPDKQAEVKAMHAQFAKAVQALKSSKLARGGADALAVLPWYVIIGPSGSGKSTVLLGSGLNFPYLTGQQKGAGRVAVRGTGGTRNCEWWLCNEAVLIDTAGRYATEDEDQAEWLSFLDMLARTRSRKPINGMLVTVSASDLGGATEDGVVALASQIRERIQEVMQRLKVIVPTYLIFTKCDVIPGFVELFADLGKNDRGQIWGFTLPRPEEGVSVGEVFGSHFQELVAVIEERAAQRISEEHHVEARERIFQFSQEFAALEANLVSFAETLYAGNVYEDAPILRGAYFTSGTQQGRTVDRIMAKMAEAFGVKPGKHETAQRTVEPKVYFLRDVFKKVVIPDQKLATCNADQKWREKLKRYALAGGGALLALCLFTFPLGSYLANRSLVNSTGAIVDEVAGTLRKPAPTLAEIEPLRERVALLVKYQDEGAPFLMRLGMYRGDELRPHVRKLYAKAVRRILVEPIFRADLAEMVAFAKQFGESGEAPLGDNAKQLDRLKLHLLLTGPKGSSEPKMDAGMRNFIVRQLQERSIGSSLQSDPADPRLIGANAELFARLLSDDPSLSFPRYEDVVRILRGILARNSPWRLAIDRLVAEVEPKRFDVTLGTIMRGQVTALRSDDRVRGAFTKDGYDLVKGLLEKGDLYSEFWVLAMDPKEDKARARVRSEYFRMYIEEWQRFLQSITVDKSEVGDGHRLLALLQGLTYGEPAPLRRLFQSVATNTRLDAGAAGVDRATGWSKMLLPKVPSLPKGLLPGSGEENAIGPSHVAAQFAGFVKFGWAEAPPAPAGSPPVPPQHLPVDDYQEQLMMLRNALRDYLDMGQAAPLKEKANAARGVVRALIDSQEQDWRAVFDEILWQPIPAVGAVVMGEKCKAVQQDWCAKVAPFIRNLASRYPFNRNGDDVDLSELAQFYQPQAGKLWAFVNESLGGEVEQSGNSFKFASKPGRCGELKPILLTFLNKSKELANALFPPGAQGPSVPFSVQLQPNPKLATVWLTIDGEKIGGYLGGPPQWYSLVWPGRTPGASLRVRDIDQREELVQQGGAWGVFRLLEAGRLKNEPAGNDFAMSWNLPALGSSVSIDFKASRGESPFLGGKQGGVQKLLGMFRAPGVIPPQSIGKSLCDS